MKQECLDEVDGFIFHPPTVAHRPYEPLVKKPHQQWILFSTESELNYPMLEGVESCRVCVCLRARGGVEMTHKLKNRSLQTPSSCPSSTST